VKKWVLSIFAWISQTLNLFLLFGHHDMTISARCYINRNKKGWRHAYIYINCLFFWQLDHCKSSFEADVKFAEEILKIKK